MKKILQAILATICLGSGVFLVGAECENVNVKLLTSAVCALVCFLSYKGLKKLGTF